MSFNQESRGLSSRSALALIFVPIAVFFSLSLIGGLLAPGAGADDETVSAYPPVSVPDLDDPSAWTSCGDSCVEPVFACQPGYTVPDGASVDESCVFAGKAPASLFPFDIIECAADELVALVQTLNEETFFEPGEPTLESQICVPATAEYLFGSSSPFECPAGYTLAPPFGPTEPYEYPLSLDGPPIGIGMPIPTATPFPTPAPATAVPIPEATATPPPPTAAPVRIPPPIAVSPENLDLPYCVNADGDEAPATIVTVVQPTNFQPTCPDGSQLWQNQDGLFCRTADGDDTPVLITAGPPVSCGGYGAILVTDPTFDYDYCISETSGQFPFCPTGFTLLGDFYYFGPLAEGDGDPFCTDDDSVIDAFYAELDARYAEHDAMKSAEHDVFKAEFEVHNEMKDAEHNAYKAELGIPDGNDLSAWTSCGDNCIEPVFVCQPGFTAAEGSGAAQLCIRDENPIDIEPEFDVIDCPGDDLVAVVGTLDEDQFFGPPGRELENQVCLPPTAENLFGPSLACPANYELVEPYGPSEPFEYPIFLDPPAVEVVPLPMPTATPVIVVPSPRSAQITPTPTPGPGRPEIEFPFCVGPDGDEAPATSSYIFEPTNYQPECPEGSDLYGSNNGLFCRSANGDESPVLVGERPAPVCNANQTLVSDPVFDSYQYCQTTTIEPYPYCPNGYLPYRPDGEIGSLICTNDDTIIGPYPIVLPASCGPDCMLELEAAAEDAAAAAQAAGSAAQDAARAVVAADGDDDEYASYPSDENETCPNFAQLSDGTCANILSGYAGSVAAPLATAVPLPTAVVGVVQQPVVAPVVVTHVTGNQVIAAADYGFGSSLPTVHAAVDTKKSAKLAHTGTEASTFLYVALSLIAGGAVAMGSRRREVEAQR